MGHSPGETLDGTYTLRAKIGSGGMSVVWKAVRVSDGTDVVIKFPNWDVHERNTVERGFRREREALSRLSGGVTPSSVVQLLDSGEPPERYLVLEFVDGPTLKDALASDSAGFDSHRAHEMALELCRAVDFVHSRGFVHLDIQPSNVLLRGGDSPVLIDFNTARTGAAPDTLFDGGRYKPPELLKSGTPEAEAGPWSDVFSLSMVISYLMTGTEPDRPERPDAAAGPEYLEGGGVPVRGPERTAEADFRNRSTSTGELFDILTGDTERSQPLRLRDENTGFEGCLVFDGDSVGRADGAASDLVVRDEEQFVSPVHFVLERDGERVRIRDRSVNGTHVRDGDGWTYLLSVSGRNRRSEELDVSLPEDTHERIRVRTPVEIRPVDRAYGIDLRLDDGELNRNSA